MSARQRVCVVGVGALGAGGSSATALGAAAWAGLTPFRLAPKEDLALSDDARLAASPLFDLATPGETRLVELLEHALREALPARLSARAKLHLALSLPTWASRAHMTEALGTSFVNVERRLAERAPCCALGNTVAGLRVLMQAIELLVAERRDELLVVLWAGVDTLIEPQLLAALEQAGLMSCSEQADGVVAGEGAAALALCTDATARALGLPVLAYLERPELYSFDNVEGRADALSRALKQTLVARPKPMKKVSASASAPAPLGAPALNTLLSDGAFLAWRSEALACALSQNAELCRSAELIYTGQLVGEVGAAFAPMASALAIFGCRHGLTQGPMSALVCADGQWTGALRIEALWQPSVLVADRQTTPYELHL